ncbi:tubulin polyglutamylase complex subunit 2 [Homo sapiens]|uniref:Tubulin polyglutamylase complex subunit 2 n=1 Tax=Homo sapiens TaxID=9606 RepID=K7ELA6_HUMAN|nr:tubulin polyglutamylase complex subunit 2 [Homo sapiens]KAI4046064.1 tubulin polyglutamylase complex subunit 2 [Homo sapiens]
MEEEASSPGLGCSKPHLEKLTLGITRILGQGTHRPTPNSRSWRNRLTSQ